MNDNSESAFRETSAKAILDYFAGKAMQGDWAAQNEDCGVFRSDVIDEVLATRARLYYRAAKAMMRARAEL